jgi:hypothetical protein
MPLDPFTLQAVAHAQALHYLKYRVLPFVVIGAAAAAYFIFGQSKPADRSATAKSNLEQTVERECPIPQTGEIPPGIPLAECKGVQEYKKSKDKKLPVREDAVVLGALQAIQVQTNTWPFPIIKSCLDISEKHTILLADDGTGYLKEGTCKTLVKNASWKAITLTEELAAMNLDEFLGSDRHDIKYVVADGQLYVRGSEGNGAEDFVHYKTHAPLAFKEGSPVRYVEPEKEVPKGIKDFTHVTSFTEYGHVALNYTSHGQKLEDIFDAPSLLIVVTGEQDQDMILEVARKQDGNYYLVQDMQPSNERIYKLPDDPRIARITVQVDQP